MVELSKYFYEAASDYLFLLGKEYPKKSILKLVGDKYQLTAKERSILFRGIHPPELCEYRKNKLTTILESSKPLFVDGYNVIRTVGSYLLGKIVFYSMDGLLRDASEMHRATLKEKVLNQTIDLLIGFFVMSNISLVTIYLDQPISKSGELASSINKRLTESGINGNAITVHSPDYHLKQITEGLICTADSSVVDTCIVNVFDLAKAILDINFQPQYINLSSQLHRNIKAGD